MAPNTRTRVLRTQDRINRGSRTLPNTAVKHPPNTANTRTQPNTRSPPHRNPEHTNTNPNTRSTNTRTRTLLRTRTRTQTRTLPSCLAARLPNCFTFLPTFLPAACLLPACYLLGYWRIFTCAQHGTAAALWRERSYYLVLRSPITLVGCTKCVPHPAQ